MESGQSMPPARRVVPYGRRYVAAIVIIPGPGPGHWSEFNVTTDSSPLSIGVVTSMSPLLRHDDRAKGRRAFSNADFGMRSAE